MAGLFPHLITLTWKPGTHQLTLSEDGTQQQLPLRAFLHQHFGKWSLEAMKALRSQLDEHQQAIVETETAETHYWLSAVREDDCVRLQIVSTMAARDSTLLKIADELCGLGYWHWHLPDNRFFWSPQVYHIHGLPMSYQPSVEDTISRYHSDDQEILRALMVEAQKAPIKRQFKARLLRDDGQWRQVSIKGVSVTDHHGQISDIFGVVQDMTFQQQSQTRMNRLALVVSQTGSGAMICDKERRVEWLNTAFERITGYGLDDLIGQRPGDFLAGKATDANTLHEVYRSMEKRQYFHGDILNYRKDGSPVWLNMSITPIYHEMHHDGFVIIVYDASTRRASEERLRLYEQAFEQANLGLLFLHEQNGQPVIDEANQAAKQLLAIGDDSKALAFPGDFFSSNPEALLSNERSGVDLTPKHAPDNTLLVLHTPLHRPDDEAPSQLVILQDITEHRRTEALLARNQKMELIGQLVSGIAHDFNNIIGIIQGNLELLNLKLEPEHPGTRSVEKALKAAKRASTLTRRLTQFSRQEPVSNEEVPAFQLLIDAEDLLSSSLGKNIALEVELDTQCGSVKVDRGDFVDAIVNLAVNARDAIADKGTIRLTCMPVLLGRQIPKLNMEVRPGPYIEFVVADTGSGIAPEHLDKILDPFFTTKPIGQGTGLGLSMVYGFVKRSKGYLQVNSELGKGTDMHIWLPQSSGGEIFTAQERPALHHLQDKRLLLVDDEADLLQVVSAQLTQLGLQVSAFEDPRQARASLKNTEYDILLCDVEMPKMSGFELAKAFRMQFPDKPILLMSGFVFSVPAELANLPRLNKPVSRTELIRYLVTLLDTQEPYGQPHSHRG
ncbi:PAS domain S-box protein [Gallaecimonas mangrovi]|uniref:PAS domain S-box protein n=1 Tax=Gallaecimonas mangrovi TaxID=2291597 RepID=UPI000E2015C7|nr:PAS domain S-box protein [Gallaecimonas mangrovi]